MPETVYLRTPRLVWRAGETEDVDGLHRIVSDFEVVRQTETWPWPVPREFTETRCVVDPSPQMVSGVITHGDRVVGYLSLTREGKLGYMFGVDHWGKGYATEIGRAAVDFAFSRFDWPRLDACVFADNPASARVLEKLGFEEGEACEGPCAARRGIFPIRTFTRPRA